MKAKYLKPSITEDLLFSEEDLLIVVSNKGDVIVEDGGTTNDNNITEGDSRTMNVWDDGE